MIHLCINPPLHHIHRLCIMYQWQLIDPSSSYQWQLIDPYLSIGFHLTFIILIKDNTYTLHQSSINHLTSINDINQSNHWHQWQHDPTIFPFGIDGNTNIDVNTNYQLLMSTCRYDMFYINRQWHQSVNPLASMTTWSNNLPLWHWWQYQHWCQHQLPIIDVNM